MPETLTVDQRLDAFEATVGKGMTDITERLEAMADPKSELKGVHTTPVDGDDGGTASYWNAGLLQESIVPGHFNEQFNPESKKGPRFKGYAPGYLGANHEGAFRSFGHFLKEGYACKGAADSEWRKKLDSIYKAVQGMSVEVATDGGFMVAPEHAAGMLERIYQNDIWARTDNYTVAGNSLIFTRNAETSRANGSRHGGLRGYWVAEGGSLTKSKPTTKQVSLRLNKLAVLVYLTEELIQDAGPAVEQLVSRKAADEFNFMLADSVFNGDGTGKPLGFLNGGSKLSIVKESGQAANTIVTENLDKMWARRLGPLVSGGTYEWYHNQDCGPQLDRLTQDVGTGGVALYREGGSIASAGPQLIKGVRRNEIEFAATLGTQNDITLADLSQILSISKGGVSQESSIHVEFLTDQTALKFTMRLDAQPWEDTAVTPFKGSNTQSAYMVLDTRA